MPFARDLDTLNPLIEKALKDEEMLDGASDAGLAVDDLKAEIQKRHESIFEAVGSDVTEFLVKEAEYALLSDRVRWQTWSSRARWAAVALLLACLATFFVYWYWYSLIVA